MPGICFQRSESVRRQRKKGAQLFLGQQRRLKAFPVQEETYLTAVIRDVERNPAAAIDGKPFIRYGFPYENDSVD